MKTRTIMATIAVAIIAGVSIFAACSKEEKKNAHPFAQNKINEADLNEVTVGYLYSGTSDITLAFDAQDYLDRLEQILNDSCSWTTNTYIAEDVQIWTDTIDPAASLYSPVMKVSFYDVTDEQGFTVYIEPRMVASAYNTDIFNLVVGLDEIHSVCTGVCHNPKGCYYTRSAYSGQIDACYCPDPHWQSDFCKISVYQNLYKTAVLWSML